MRLWSCSLASRFEMVIFGGSLCPDPLGDKLVANGVNLVSDYGSTETRMLRSSLRPAGDKAWNYLRPSSAVSPFLRFEHKHGNLFALICLDGWPSKAIANCPDGAYATRDLFEKHASIEAYKYHARLDDTLVLVTGEKVNPLIIEGVVRQNELLVEAVVFGAGKVHVGIAIVLSEGASHFSGEENYGQNYGNSGDGKRDNARLRQSVSRHDPFAAKVHDIWEGCQRNGHSPSFLTTVCGGN